MGRFGYFAVAGSALVAGMVVQGDIDLGSDPDGRDRAVDVVRDRDGKIDRTVDRIVDRATDRIEIRADDGRPVATDRATRRALAEAVKELVRAESSLIAAKMNDALPPAAIKQAEHRRDLARQAVERITDDAKAESRGDRDALRKSIRDEVRAEIRDALRN